MEMTPEMFHAAFNLAFLCTVTSANAVDKALQDGRTEDAMHAHDALKHNAAAFNDMVLAAFDFGFADVV